jgi:hypothetical protein
MSVFDNVLIVLGGNATVLAVLAFLARSLVQTWLAKDVKRFETNLQSSATSELERLKSDLKAKGGIAIEELKSRLQLATIEHQVRFSKLHEARAQIIADLYKRIAEQSVACQRYVYQLTESNRQERFIELEKGFSDFYLFSETSRIYLPEHVYGLLEKLISTIRNPAVDVFVYGGTDNHANEAVQEERKRAFVEAFKAFEAEVPAAKKALEDEFRKLLGVENSPPPLK